MKKRVIAVIAAALLSTIVARAQMEVSAGYIYALTRNTSKAEDGYKSVDRASSNGVYVGVTDSFVFAQGFKLRYAICYCFLTGEDTRYLKIFEDPRYPIISETGRAVTDEHYISVPVITGYSIRLVDNLDGYAYGGLAISYCLSSKSYSTWPNVGGVNYWNVNHFAGDTNYNGYRRFDARVSAGFGFEILKKVRMECGIDYGLLDRSKSSASLHHFTWHLGLAYIF